MKVSDAIAAFLAQHVKHVFCISGGASLHMIDSIAKRKDISYVCPQNEQTASFAADSYARLEGMGCALTTSGPGATNLITGIATSFYDSVPVLYVTGQQTRNRLSAGTGCRQIGFQETPITEIVRPITKYARTLMSPDDVLQCLPLAVSIAKSGRPGPVLIDVPDDLQRMQMADGAQFAPVTTLPVHQHINAKAIVRDILAAKRPLFIFGAGVKDPVTARHIIEALGVPCVVTWGALDHFGDHPLCLGGFGTHGVRAANFAVQNADYILTVGTRLDTKATGSPASAFAPKAKLVMVDIDAAELGKMDRIGRPLQQSIRADSGDFLKELGTEIDATREIESKDSWRLQCEDWRDEFSPLLREYKSEPANPYVFIDALSDWLHPEDVIVSDTGCALGWMAQAFRFSGQRFIHAWNNTPMGYGLPAAIGASFAVADRVQRRVVLITGDGGLAVNITELATVARHKLPIKIILFNNRGHAMCRQTQRTWFDGSYPSTSYEGGLATPDYCAVAKAYGIPSYSVDTVRDAVLLQGGFTHLLYDRGPAFLEFNVPDHYQISPQVRAGKLLHDADPSLPAEVLERVMA